MDETLEHHGIKGMKWGVRRTSEQLGHPQAQKLSKRIVRKQLRSEKGKSLEGTHRGKVIEKMNAEAARDKDIKSHAEKTQALANFVNKTAKANGIRPDQIVFKKDDPLIKEFNASADRADAAGKRILESYKDRYAGAALKDLGYQDTAEGRAWMIKYFGDDM